MVPRVIWMLIKAFRVTLKKIPEALPIPLSHKTPPPSPTFQRKNKKSPNKKTKDKEKKDTNHFRSPRLSDPKGKKFTFGAFFPKNY